MTLRIKRRSRRAFTLIELLVVISIIALLIGILLPVLGVARRTARNAICLANIRQYGIGTVGFATDEDGRLPYVTSNATENDFGLDVDGLTGTKVYRWDKWWPNGMTRYLGLESYESIIDRAVASGDGTDVPLPGDDSVFICPEADPPDPAFDNAGASPYAIPSGDTGDEHFYFNYVYNSQLDDDDDATDRWPGTTAKTLRLESILKPSDTILFVELRSTEAEFERTGGSTFVDPRGDVVNNGADRDKANWLRLGMRHDGDSTNITFADGHASNEKYLDATNENFSVSFGSDYNNPGLIWNPFGAAN
ncbi:MAG: prepilin-type N-terminal cleavage/methylation domain-containing protein [Planctomycetota bacterium]